MRITQRLRSRPAETARAEDDLGEKSPSVRTAARRQPAARRVLAMDRVWVGHWSVVAAAPVAVPPVEALREQFVEFMESHPAHELACRLQADGSHWLQVPPAERAAHAQQVVVSGAELDLDDIPAYIIEHRPEVASLPIRVVVSERSILYFLTHLAGDGYTVTDTFSALLSGDLAATAGRRGRADASVLRTAFLHQDRAVQRSWLNRTVELVRSRLRPAHAAEARPTVPQSAPATAGPPVPQPAPATAGPSGTAGPALAGAVLSNTGIRGLIRWRNKHCSGASLTAVLASRTYLALLEQGVPMCGSGFFSLFDIRTYLAAEHGPLWGNLAKSLFLDCDLADPIAVDAAMDEVMATRRAIPGLVSGAVATRLRAPRPRVGYDAALTEVTLTFNSMPSLPGLDALPWIGTGRRRYFGSGLPTAPGGMSVFALRLRDRMEITASFDRASAAPDAVQAALAAIALP